MNTDLRKEAKDDFEKDFFNFMNNVFQFLEKPWKIFKTIQTLKLYKERKEETIWYQNQIVKQQSFSQKICCL